MFSLLHPLCGQSVPSGVNHRLESRVREIRLHGSEGGAPGNRSFLPLSNSSSFSRLLLRIPSAPGKAWHLLQGGSPCRARPNQPPVSSVAYATEEVKQVEATFPEEESSARHLEWPNNAYEAYTENPVGRRGGRTSLKRFSLVTAKQSATMLPNRKPTQRGRDW
jgi:hypothetical protein